MFVGNISLNSILNTRDVYIINNIFMTLALGMTLLNAIELARDSKGMKRIGLIIITIFLLPLSIFTEGGITVIPFILITYFFRNSIRKTIIGYIVLSLILFKINFVWYGDISSTIEMLMFNSDFLFILAIPFILGYNGERGINNKFTKYLFYIFYPMHIWILAICRFILN